MDKFVFNVQLFAAPSVPSDIKLFGLSGAGASIMGVSGANWVNITDSASLYGLSVANNTFYVNSASWAGGVFDGSQLSGSASIAISDKATIAGLSFDSLNNASAAIYINSDRNSLSLVQGELALGSASNTFAAAGGFSDWGASGTAINNWKAAAGALLSANYEIGSGSFTMNLGGASAEQSYSIQGTSTITFNGLSGLSMAAAGDMTEFSATLGFGGALGLIRGASAASIDSPYGNTAGGWSTASGDAFKITGGTSTAIIGIIASGDATNTTTIKYGTVDLTTYGGESFKAYTVNNSSSTAFIAGAVSGTNDGTRVVYTSTQSNVQMLNGFKYTGNATLEAGGLSNGASNVWVGSGSLAVGAISGVSADQDGNNTNFYLNTGVTGLQLGSLSTGDGTTFKSTTSLTFSSNIAAGTHVVTAKNEVTDINNFTAGNVTVSGASSLLSGGISIGGLSEGNARFIIAGESDGSVWFGAASGTSGVATVGGIGGASVNISGLVGDTTLLFSQGAGASMVKFGAAGESFVFGSTNDSLTFGMSGESAITISNFTAGTIKGAFTYASSINGAAWSVSGGGDAMSITGGAANKGITQIWNVAGGAKITNAANATLVGMAGVTGGVSTIQFGEAAAYSLNNTAKDLQFTINDKLAVTKISGLSGIVGGALNGISLKSGGAISITGDSDFSVQAETTDANYKLLGVGGDNVTIASTGAATEVEINAAGNYKVGDKTFAITDSAVTFGISNSSVLGSISGLSGTATGDFSADKFTINGEVFQVKGDATVGAVTGSDGKVTGIEGLTGGATVASAKDATSAKTDSTGAFTFGKVSYTVGGDSEVTFGLSSLAVTGISGFANGTISGSLNGLAINSGSAIGVKNDTDFNVVADADGVLSLTGLGDASKVVSITSAGGATKVITDVAGKFAFGSTQQITIGGDSSVEFTVDTNSTVTAVDSIASATLSVSSDTTSISINGGEAIKFAAADKKTPTFVIDSNGKITEVSGASLVSGLTGDVNVIETSSAKIGDNDINITGDTSYAVSVVSGAVGEISSVSANATVNVKNATVNTDSTGKFTFASDVYDVGDDNAVQFITGENSVVSAINGLEGTIQTSDKEITINGDEVVITGMETASLVTYDGGTSGIDAITGLTNNATVTGATSAALNLVGTTSTSVATSLTANGKLFQLLNDSDGVTITGGEVVTGLGSGASLVASNAGTYTVNGTVLNVAAGETIRGTSEGTAEIYDPSNVAEVNESVAAAVESLASAIINTEDYEDLSKDTTKLAEVTEAINSTSASADKSALNGDMKFAVSVPSGSTSQDVDLSANTGKKDVTLTTGNQSLKFNNEGGNVAEIGKDASGEKTVELGNGGDVVAIAKGADKKATINITAGTGPDTVVSGANASVDVGKGGATKVRAVGGATVTMNNYSAADSKAGVQTTNSDIAAAIGNGNITLENGVVGTSEGKVALNSGSSSADVVTSADSGDTEGSTIANLYNNAGKMTKVGFTHNDGGTVDLSGQKANTVIQGNNAATNKSGESTLLGGSGNDTIFAGSGDAIDAGAGANTIVLKDASSRSTDAEKGATIAMTSATGRNKVQNFNTGFEDGKDAISVDLTNAKFSIDGDGNLIVKNGRAKTTVESAASTSGDISADATDGVANVLITDSSTGTTTKTAVAGEGKTIVVSNDEESFANSYIGDGSGLNFGSYESEVNLNLAGTTATFGGEDVEVSGINNVKLGEADATVFGSSAKETITAGSGNETIWAGAGKDTLNGYSGSADDKSGSITFGFMAGDGKDVINNFGYLTTENAQTADRVWTTGQFEAALSGNDVVLSFSGNKKDSLRITDAKGQNIQLSENGDLNNVTTVLQVSDTLLTYDGLATKYIATGSNAAVVASSLASSANIWLEDKYVNLSNNTTYTGKIKAVDAAAVEGSATLVGNSYDNMITGAQGSSSMWGGDSTSNDTMIGGTEGNMFFYGVTGGNEGNDTITGITEDDTVNLFGIQLADISDFDITNSTIALKFSAGGSLTMGNNGQTFMLGNDQNQRYTYDKENSEWTKA